MDKQKHGLTMKTCMTAIALDPSLSRGEPASPEGGCGTCTEYLAQAVARRFCSPLSGCVDIKGPPCWAAKTPSA